MNPTNRMQQLSAAHAELSNRRFPEAERLFLLMLTARKDDRDALEGLAAVYLQSGRFDQAESTLRGMVTLWADIPGYRLELAALLERKGKLPDAAACYAEVIRKWPDLAVARFNLACFLKRAGRPEEALREHQKALDLNIEQPEEVLSNIAVIHTELHRDEDARGFLQRALAINPNFIPALYNLALLHEEFGARFDALTLFNRILELDPTYYNALVRIAHARNVTDPADPLVKQLRKALRREHVDPLSRESLHFALGKVLDDCGAYDEAFEQYREGNRCSAARLRPYDREAEEKRTGQVMQVFDSEWLARAEPVSDRPLVFITGMFRSGSTLFEQVLAAHPRVTAGGEIDYFGRLIARSALQFPAAFAQPDAAAWRKLGAGYLEYLDRTFPGGTIVTNKRPDAFSLLGLLKGLFPNARFVNTVRDPLDTCLSIYFQQLDDRITYASDLENIAHHYLQYQRLMDHWKQLFGGQIFDAPYDELVAVRRTTTATLLRFLGLEWNDGCLEFERLGNRVRTASVWQVREPLYRKSSGRWRNYKHHLESVRRLLAGTEVADESIRALSPDDRLGPDPLRK